MLSHHHTTTLLRRTHTLPIRFFSWSAASLATIAALSFDAPAFGHRFPVAESGYIYYDQPTCSISIGDAYLSGELEPLDSSGSYVGDSYQNYDVIAYSIKSRRFSDDGEELSPDHNYCHVHYEVENNSPRLTEELTLILDRTNPDILRYYFDLDRHFTDPDGDPLIYSAESSDPSQVRVEVSGNRLILTLSARGATATIKVIADDGETTTTTSFDVKSPNEPPRATGSIPDQTFLASGGVGSSELCNLEEDTKFNTDLSSLFFDPEGDELTYEVTGSPSWIRASVSGSTLDLNALQSAVEGDSTTITVTASDGKDDGEASLSFNVNIVAEKTPKPILSKKAISLTLTEVPPTVEVPPELRIPNTDFLLAQDSYSVTLSCQYRFPVTVEISNTPGSLEIGPTRLTFNETNWDVPQTVRVKTVGTTPGSFTLSHAAVTTNSEGKTVRESDNLSITVALDSDTSEVRDTSEIIEDQGKAAAKKTAEKLAKKYAPKIAAKVIPGVNAVIGVGQLIKNREGITEIFTDLGKGLGLTSNSSSGSSNEQLNSLAENLYIHHEALQNGNISLDQAFSGQRFYVPFSLAQTDSKGQGSSPRFNALLSADIGFSRFSDSSDPDLSIDGTTTNYGIGLTLLPNPEVPLVTGLQLGYTRSNSDFEHPEMEGTYNLRMFSVSPYIAWDATDSLTVWSTIGYGRPNDEMIIESVDGVDFDSTEDSTFTSSGDFFSFSGGANYRVWQSDLSALSLNLSGSTTSLLDNDSQQGSISAQFSHDFPFNTGQLKTSADLALILSDSGPSATELSGQLNWLPNQGRLSGSTNARVLLFGGDRSEWGIGGSVVLLPGERGEGLSLALQPSFGQTNASLSSLHLDPFSFSDPTELALRSSPLTARFNAELAYGFPSGNHALLTPYTKLSMGHYGTTTSAGLRYQLDNSLDLDLSASHRTRSNGNNDNRFFLQLRSDL